MRRTIYLLIIILNMQMLTADMGQTVQAQQRIRSRSSRPLDLLQRPPQPETLDRERQRLNRQQERREQRLLEEQVRQQETLGRIQPRQENIQELEQGRVQRRLEQEQNRLENRQEQRERQLLNQQPSLR